MSAKTKFYFSSIINFLLVQVLSLLVEGTKDIKGAKVENNKFCVSVHYRNVDDKVEFTCFS